MQHAVRVVALQGAILGMLREAQQEGADFDGLTITAERDPDGSISIDLMHTLRGVPVAGEGL